MAKRKYVKENNLVKAINTDSLELQKPLVNEYYDINVHNSNMDKIDAGYRQNKNDISNINYELSKTENTKYSTTNGVKEFSCKDGYVDNIAIEGETLVNLCRKIKNVEIDTDKELLELYGNDNHARISNGTFTVINLSNKTIYFDFKNISNGSHLAKNSITNGSLVVEIPSNGYIKSLYGYFVDGWGSSDVDEFEKSIIILEGDHTDKPISYFEGLKSVGQGDKIEVASQGGNIFDGMFEYGSIKTADGLLEYKAECIRSINYIPIYEKELYSWNDKGYSFVTFYYDINKNFISSGGNIPPKNARYLKFRSSYNSNQNDLNVKWVVSYNEVNKYIPHKQDHKQISTTLRSLPNGVRDTIEKRGNKYVKVQRCGEYTFTGGEPIEHMDSDTTGYVQANIFVPFTLAPTIIDDKTSIGNIICNILPDNGNVAGCETLFRHPSKANIIVTRISNSKITNNKTDYLNYLKDNLTIVYELETPIITELPNFNPQTYEGDTTLLINTGVIQAECEFEVTNSKGSEIEVLKDKVSSLDDNIVEVYNPQLLNGFYKLYPEDDSYIRKYNNVVVMNLRLANPANVSDGTLVFTLPPRFRPPARVSSNVCNGLTGMATGLLVVRNDGSVVMYNSTDLSDIRVNIVYMAR